MRDIFYYANCNTDEIIAYNTTTLAELARYPVGEDIVTQPAGSKNQDDTMSFSGNGKYLFLSTPSGIRVFDISTVPEPSTLVIAALIFAPLAAYRRRH